MVNDKTTLKDLSIFPADGTDGVFALIDRTTTFAGRDTLRQYVHQAPSTVAQLIAVQDTVKYWARNAHQWPTAVSNGTIVMLEQFFEAADQTTIPPAGLSLLLGSTLQKLLNKRAYYAARFTVGHLADFLKGCQQLTTLLSDSTLPPLLAQELQTITQLLQHRLAEPIASAGDRTSYSAMMRLQHQARRELKSTIQLLIAAYARIDAWRALAVAGNEHNWAFPVVTDTPRATIAVLGLYHPLLERAVGYDVTLDDHQRLMVLTGANMSGKTTFMRALGVAALLAHLGMAVPAKHMSIGFLQGIITNMHVEDSILRGESYFLAEVLRMKHTATRLLQPGCHLVLMDELFKGTNVHDAYECTRAVVDGLLLHPSHLMILSTHLYEVATTLQQRTDIMFAHFITHLETDGSYQFTYQLRNGVSDDRIGYRILEREGVIGLLRRTDHGRKG
jgi:DNA mismatch repair protein MutS